MYYKPYTKKARLLQDIKTYTTNKNFCKKQANLSKYASIFACCGAGLATISAQSYTPLKRKGQTTKHGYSFRKNTKKKSNIKTTPQNTIKTNEIKQIKSIN